MTDIFLSYSSKDRERVRQVRDALAALSYDVFWDQQVPVGESWEPWIKRHLSSAKVVLVLWSKNSVASDPVKYEARVAKEMGKLLPAQIDMLNTFDFPMGFETLQCAQLQDWRQHSSHAAFEGLVSTIAARLSEADSRKSDQPKRLDPDDVNDLKRRAEAGEPMAQALLGFYYFRGSRGLPKDIEEGMRLTRLAAEKGVPGALHNLAISYENGEGVEINAAEAMRLHKLAADQGWKSAQLALAIGHLEGRGVSRDPVEAAKLLKLAAGQGSSEAQYKLAVMLTDGWGVSVDKAEAMRLFKLAAVGGDKKAQSYLQTKGIAW